MVWILLIRWIIFITFLLLLAEGVGAVFLVRWFYARYITKHRELEDDLQSAKRRISVLEEAMIHS